jgi:DNA polymerase III epsilon subunit-like protein
LRQTFSALVRSPIPVPPESSAVHHLIDEDLAFAPQLDDVLELEHALHPER